MEEAASEPTMTWTQACTELIKFGVSPQTQVMPTDLSFMALSLAASDPAAAVARFAEHLTARGIKSCGNMRALSKHEIMTIALGFLKTADGSCKVKGGAGALVDQVSTMLKHAFKVRILACLQTAHSNPKTSSHVRTPALLAAE